MQIIRQEFICTQRAVMSAHPLGGMQKSGNLGDFSFHCDWPVGGAVVQKNKKPCNKYIYEQNKLS